MKEKERLLRKRKEMPEECDRKTKKGQRIIRKETKKKE